MSERYRVIFYSDERDRCPTTVFLKSLSIKIEAKLNRWIDRLEELGPDLPRPYADILRGKIRELRLTFASQQYRFLYFFWGKVVVITHGFLKKTAEVPEAEIDRARRYMDDFEIRLKMGDVDI